MAALSTATACNSSLAATPSDSNPASPRASSTPDSVASYRPESSVTLASLGDTAAAPEPKALSTEAQAWLPSELMSMLYAA